MLAEEQLNKNNQYGQSAFLVDPQNPTYKVDSSALLLTRDHMINEPPDILFTTTEMLNVRLSKRVNINYSGWMPTRSRQP